MTALILLASCTGADPIDTGYAGEPSDLCVRYCTAMTQICTDEYAIESDCYRACDDWAEDGREGVREGDSVQCRITYAELGQCANATTDSPECVPVDGNGGDGGNDSGV